MKKIFLILSFITAGVSQASEINSLECSNKPSYLNVNYDADKNIHRVKFKDSQSSSESKDTGQAHIDKILLKLETQYENDKKAKDKNQESIKALRDKQQQDIEDMRERAQEYMTILDKQKQERERKARELAKKPNAKIGMTKKQVLNDTNWGEPNGIRTFTTAKGTSEVWSYGSYQYLYFDNDKLTMIEQ